MPNAPALILKSFKNCSMYSHRDSFKQVNGQIYHCSHELGGYELFSGKSDVVYYGLADFVNRVFVQYSNGKQLVYKNVADDSFFDLRTGSAVETVIDKIEVGGSHPQKVDWLIQPASPTDLIKLIETFQYNITLKLGMFCTEHPEQFIGDPDNIFPFDFIEDTPTRIK